MLAKISFLSLLLFSFVSEAQVCDGAAVGKTTMVSGAMSYCNGSSWQSMKGTQGTACTAGENGRMRFQSAKFEFCDGSFWFEMKSGSAISSCAGNAGRVRWNSNRKEFCDGTSWFDMTAVGGSASCTSGFVSWGAGGFCSESGVPTILDGQSYNASVAIGGACGGSAVFQCVNGTFVLQPGSTCQDTNCD